MSKGYAIAFILTTLSVFGSLFFLQHQVIHEQYRQLAANNVEVHDRVIAQQVEQQQELVRRIDDRLNDDAKTKFRPVEPFFAEVQERQAVSMQLYQQIKKANRPSSSKLHDLAEQLSANLKETREAFARLLLEHGENMDLTKEDAMTLASTAKEFCVAASTSINVLSAKQSGAETTALAGLLMTDYLQAEQRVLEMAGMISGGKVISCFFGPEFFPVVSTGFLNPKRGEKISTQLSVGSYATTLDPEDITIIIEGDSLKPNMAGYIDYDFVAHRRGKQELEMELVLKNPLTGEVNKQGITKYHYFVR